MEVIELKRFTSADHCAFQKGRDQFRGFKDQRLLVELTACQRFEVFEAERWIGQNLGDSLFLAGILRPVRHIGLNDAITA